MSLESFIGFDQGEGMSEAAFEAFKERMAAAAAQIAAMKKEEGKQKKKEEELLHILLKFIKNSQKKDLVLLISRVLEQNVPANFILAVILLGNEDIQAEVGRFLQIEARRFAAGPDPQTVATEGSEGPLPHSSSYPTHDELPPSSDHSLTFFSSEDQTLPLKIKIELDNWIRDLLFQAGENPQKLLKTAYDIQMIELEKEYDFEESKYEEKKEIKVVLIQLLAFIIRDFLEQHDIMESYEKLGDFARFILTGILNKTQESLDNRKLLGD